MKSISIVICMFIVLEGNCLGKAVCRFAAETAAGEYASEVAHEMWENNREPIEKAVDHISSELDKADKDAADRIKHDIERGDYFQAAIDHEGSGRDAGDGCTIM